MENTTQINFEKLNQFLIEAIAPKELACLIDESIHAFTILLIENPDKFPFKDSSGQIHYLRELKKLFENMQSK